VKRGCQAILLMGCLVAVGSGCAARLGRDYGHVLFNSADYFQIQIVTPGGAKDQTIAIDNLLLLPAVGDLPEELIDGMLLTVWQELQQIIPGSVIMPRERGRFAAYTTTANLLGDDGRPAVQEIIQIGRVTGSSHVLLPRIRDYRPYHPQRIVMEWMLFDVKRGQMVLLMVGNMDASEQRVLVAADAYLRQRKAKEYSSSNLDMMLRSPRDFNGFAMAQAVSALKGKLVVASSASMKPAEFKELHKTDDNYKYLREIK